jgi:hypothetical protein
VNPLLENVRLFVHALAHANEILKFMHANRLHMIILPRVRGANATSDIHADGGPVRHCGTVIGVHAPRILPRVVLQGPRGHSKICARVQGGVC